MGVGTDWGGVGRKQAIRDHPAAMKCAEASGRFPFDLSGLAPRPRLILSHVRGCTCVL